MDPRGCVLPSRESWMLGNAGCVQVPCGRRMHRFGPYPRRSGDNVRGGEIEWWTCCGRFAAEPNMLVLNLVLTPRNALGTYLVMVMVVSRGDVARTINCEYSTEKGC